MGITFAIFYLFGNIPVVKDWLIINVTDSHISFFMNFNKLFDIPSFPKLHLEFKLSIMFIVVLTSIGLKPKVLQHGCFK